MFHLLVEIGLLPVYKHGFLKLHWYLVAAESRISKQSGVQGEEKTVIFTSCCVNVPRVLTEGCT